MIKIPDKQWPAHFGQVLTTTPNAVTLDYGKTMKDHLEKQQIALKGVIGDPTLMDVRAAARYLRVSEISVRRYTNSGVLKCVRIGGRHERRFRLADLEAFLEVRFPALHPPDMGQTASSSGSANAVARKAFANIDEMDVPWGSHLCQLYETDRGRLQMAVPFLADGLETSNACFVVASPGVRKLIVSAMKRIRPDLDADIASGRMRLLDVTSNSKDMLSLLDKAFGEAMDMGDLEADAQRTVPLSRTKHCCTSASRARCRETPTAASGTRFPWFQGSQVAISGAPAGGNKKGCSSWRNLEAMLDE